MEIKMPLVYVCTTVKEVSVGSLEEAVLTSDMEKTKKVLIIKRLLDIGVVDAKGIVDDYSRRL